MPHPIIRECQAHFDTTEDAYEHAMAWHEEMRPSDVDDAYTDFLLTPEGILGESCMRMMDNYRAHEPKPKLDPEDDPNDIPF